MSVEFRCCRLSIFQFEEEIKKVLTILERFKLSTWATFDPKMDIESSRTCAIDICGLYNGSISGPYQSFSSVTNFVENIFVRLKILKRLEERNNLK